MGVCMYVEDVGGIMYACENSSRDRPKMRKSDFSDFRIFPRKIAFSRSPVYVWVYVCMYEDLRGNLAKIPKKLGKNRTKIEKNRNFWDFWGFCGISS